jgi:hypothetical protein
MKATMAWLSTVVLFATAIFVTVSAQPQSIAGKWDLSVDTPHGKLTLELDVKQDGAVVSGTLLNFQSQKQPVKGEFKGAALSLQTTSGDDIALSATLKPDGTLAGQLSMAQGDTNWTGTRAKKAQ